MNMKRLAQACCGVAVLGIFAASLFAVPTMAGGGDGVVASASGSGHYTVNDELRTFAFNAVEHADGTVNGHYQLEARAPVEAVMQGRVTCLTIVGNQVWVGGITERSSNPAIIEGTVSYFRAIDNGEGSAGLADRLTPVRFNDLPGQDIVFCTDLPTRLPLRDIEHGNIQVR